MYKLPCIERSVTFNFVLQVYSVYIQCKLSV
jgi:hypothetical protein